MQSVTQPCHKSGSLWKNIRRNQYVYLFIAISLSFYIVFCYVPMYGIVLAFKNYNAAKGILASPFIGFKHYVNLFREPAFWRAFSNTVVISFSRIAFEFPAPVILALLLNEVRMKKYRKVLQTVYTFPNFLSWVIVSSVALNVLGSEGLFNNLLSLAGVEKQQFLANKALFRPILYITDVWKGSGWTSIIYLAAITSISMDLYEAAIIDGANRFQKMIHVTLPCIRSVIIIMLLLAVGSTMNAGFDQIFNMYNPAVEKVADILDTYIYRITFQTSGDFGFSTAVGLFKSVINFGLLLGFDKLAKRFGESGLF